MGKVWICLLNEIIIYIDVTCQLFAVLTHVLWFYIYNIESTLHPDGRFAFLVGPCRKSSVCFYLFIYIFLLIGWFSAEYQINAHWPIEIRRHWTKIFAYVVGGVLIKCSKNICKSNKLCSKNESIGNHRNKRYWNFLGSS